MTRSNTPLPYKFVRRGLPYNAVATFCFSSDNHCLYHRSLTKKSQGKIVDDMVKQGYYDGEFPPLKTITEPLQIDRSLVKQKVDDGSYIENVEGSVVYVKDPKNKATIKVFI